MADPSVFRMPRMRLTAGEVLPDGAILDLVSVPAQAGLSLLLADGSAEPRIGSTITHGGDIYQAIPVDPSILSAVRFPSSLAPYGTIAELFERISSLYRVFLGWSEESSTLKAIFDIASWLPEMLPVSLTVGILSPTLRQVFNLLAISGAVCRRALCVARLSDRLPLFLRPALYLTDPNLSEEDCFFLSATGIRGVYAAGAAGTIRELNVLKVVMIYNFELLDALGDEVIPIDLPSTEVPDLDDGRVALIAEEFQPRLLGYRLDCLRNRRQFEEYPYSPALSGLAQNLFAVVQRDPQIVEVLTRVLQLREEDRQKIRDRNPRIACQSAVWAPSHSQREMAVAEITTRVNALISSLGGRDEYNAMQIGRVLRGLQLNTRNNGSRKVLPFSDEVRSRIHQCVREFGLQLPLFDNCPDCKGLQSTEQKPIR